MSFITNLATPADQEVSIKNILDSSSLKEHLPAELLESLGGANNVLATIPQNQRDFEEPATDSPTSLFWYGKNIDLEDITPGHATEIKIFADSVVFVLRREIKHYRFPHPKYSTNPLTLLRFSNKTHTIHGPVVTDRFPLSLLRGFTKPEPQTFWTESMLSIATIASLIKNNTEVVQDPAWLIDQKEGEKMIQEDME